MNAFEYRAGVMSNEQIACDKCCDEGYGCQAHRRGQSERHEAAAKCVFQNESCGNGEHGARCPQVGKANADKHGEPCAAKAAEGGAKKEQRCVVGKNA